MILNSNNPYIPGLYTVTLRVTDGVGLWNEDKIDILVLDITRPIADAGLDLIIDEGTWVTFDGTGSRDNVGIDNYIWTFKDIGFKTLFGIQPIYQFNNPGVFQIILNVTDAENNWDTDAMTVTVNDITAPIANAGPDQVVNEKEIVFFKSIPL